MTTYGVCNLKSKVCGVCRWWSGERMVELTMNTPRFVKAAAGSFPCIAQKRNCTSNQTCLKFQLWEKL